MRKIIFNYTASAFVFFFFIILTAGKNSSCGEYSSADISDTIHIGKQVWMKHNQTFRMPKSWFYDNDSSLEGQKNGRLYYYSNAIASCPRGWHVPSNEEWQQLIDFLGGDSLSGDKLKPGGSSGLDLPLAGYKSANSEYDLFGKKGEQGFYWSSTIKGDQTAYARTFEAKNSIVGMNYYRRSDAFSVRLLKD